MSNVTEIINAIAARQEPPGDLYRELETILYRELRGLAAAKLKHEHQAHSLDTTALVHETYLRLMRPPAGSAPEEGEEQSLHNAWQNRAHFFAAAAEAMRRILIDAARKRRAAKRGGGLTKHDAATATLFAKTNDDELIAVDELMDQLAVADPQAAQLVKLRVFAGVPMNEIAEILQVSPRTAHNLWTYARAWLKDKLAP